MSGALPAALIWLLAANLLAMLPARDNHWRRAYVLIALALPLSLWLALQAGLWWTLAFLIAAASIMRWPLIHLWRWIKARMS
jgi:hypothetical protein